MPSCLRFLHYVLPLPHRKKRTEKAFSCLESKVPSNFANGNQWVTRGVDSPSLEVLKQRLDRKPSLGGALALDFLHWARWPYKTHSRSDSMYLRQSHGKCSIDYSWMKDVVIFSPRDGKRYPWPTHYSLKLQAQIWVQEHLKLTRLVGRGGQRERRWNFYRCMCHSCVRYSGTSLGKGQLFWLIGWTHCPAHI